MNHLLRIIILMLLLFLVTCSEEEPPPPLGPTGSFDEVIDGAGEFEEVVDSHIESEEWVDDANNPDGEIYYCTYQHHSVTSGLMDYPLFQAAGAYAEIIYPGNLLQGAYLDLDPPKPIFIGRGPGTIVMTVMSGRDSTEVVGLTVPEVSLLSIFQAANEIVNDAIDRDLAANTKVQYETISSKEQLELVIGFHLQNAALDIGAELGYNHRVDYNRVLVKLEQAYYTIVYDPPKTYDDVFASNVTPTQLAKYVGPGNPAAFISSVTYGRIFYLLIQSTETSDSLSIKVSASFDAAASVDVGVGINYVKSLENKTIKLVAVGGESNLALKALNAVNGDFEGLKTFIEEGGKVTTGVPISYQVRSLARPDQILRAKMATEYDETHCIPIGQSLENPICWYRAGFPGNSTFDTLSATYVKTLVDINGSTLMNANATGLCGGKLLKGVIPSQDPQLPALDAVKCYWEAGMVDGFFQYGGDKFQGTDYTIFVVAKLEDLLIPYPAYFLYGTSPTPLKNLSVGFWDDHTLILSHRGHDCRGLLPAQYSADQYNVYTFRFSQEDGMSIYVDLEREPINCDASKTSALLEHPGGRVGSSGGDPILIAEILAYGVAASEAQRLSIIRGIKERYSLPAP